MPETDYPEKACLYAYSDRDDNGQLIVDAAVEIDCRWEFVQREILISPGVRSRVDAQVAVDQEIALGSILWRGSLDDLPTTPTDLYEVVGRKEAKDMRGVETRRELLLMRYGDTLPTLSS